MSVMWKQAFVAAATVAAASHAGANVGPSDLSSLRGSSNNIVMQAGDVKLICKPSGGAGFYDGRDLVASYDPSGAAVVSYTQQVGEGPKIYALENNGEVSELSSGKKVAVTNPEIKEAVETLIGQMKAECANYFPQVKVPAAPAGVNPVPFTAPNVTPSAVPSRPTESWGSGAADTSPSP